MLTGDFGLTAKTIATQIGLMSEKGRVVQGDELAAMSTAQLEQILRDEPEIIFARIAPEGEVRELFHLTIDEIRARLAPLADDVDQRLDQLAESRGAIEGTKGTAEAVVFVEKIRAEEFLQTVIKSVAIPIAYTEASQPKRICPHVDRILIRRQSEFKSG